MQRFKAIIIGVGGVQFEGLGEEDTSDAHIKTDSDRVGGEGEGKGDFGVIVEEEEGWIEEMRVMGEMIFRRCV